MSQTIISDDSLTFAEKIISLRADGASKVHRTGEIAVLPADMAMAHDNTGPLACNEITLISDIRYRYTDIEASTSEGGEKYEST